MSASATCPNCGAENRSDAKLCRSCGTALVASPPAAQAPSQGEGRKVVTVLFSDVAESTVLAQQMDPESLRMILLRFFEEMRSAVERHGGAVEKYVGDAILAIFGIPRLHEDDALRAVRAAVDMREALDTVNEELERTWGVRIVTRTGINTGEVFAAAPLVDQSLVVGDAVNVAARLEQTARPGDIVIGERTHELVRDAIVAEEVGPLTLKGIAEPVVAWKVIEVIAGAPGRLRRLDSPLIARDRELQSLAGSLDGAVRARSGQLVVVMGTAGVGKSRLATEFLSGLNGTTVLNGRCLPYGQGITFWPVVEVLRDAAGIEEKDSPEDARTRISSLLPPGDESALVVERLATLLGLGRKTTDIQETFWAVRRLLERLADQRPLVVAFDDIHWGEPTFLDLLEYLTASIRTVPVVLLCLARPELLEARPSWRETRPNATLIALESLTAPQIDRLIHNLLGGENLAKEARTRIAEVTEGNPLFVEETLQMFVDEGLLQRDDARWTFVGEISGVSIPPTIHALLTARLDRLDIEERALVERASVVGRMFDLEAVSVLSQEETRPRLGNRLESLLRKELIRRQSADGREEESYAFSHILIRDAAYDAIPKSARAELHRRLAEWMQIKSRDRTGEADEIVGYHLEQAYRALAELGGAPERFEALGREAAHVLASAGRRAFTRGDMPAVVNLLSRAAALLPERDPERLELLPQLAFGLMETGDFARLQAVVAETGEAATASGSRGLQANAVILGLWIRLFTDPEGWAEEASREASRAIETFKELGDERGLVKGWSVLGLVHSLRAEFARAEQAWEEATAHAHQAGDHRDESESLSWIPLTVWAGPTPAEQGLRRCREVVERAKGDKKPISSALFIQAAFEAGLGRFNEARDLIARAKGMLEEVALTVWIAGPLTQVSAWVELMAGDPGSAERQLRWGYQTLKEIGELSWLSTTAAILAESLYQLERYEEADEFTAASEQAAASDDAYSQVLWRIVRAKARARMGKASEAQALAREAVEMAEPTDFLHLRSQALMGLAEVLAATERAHDAHPFLAEAIRLSEEKGNVVTARRARELVASLGE